MKKVLIIEDDGALRTTLVSALESEGFLALTASDGAEGLSKASSDEPDLVVLDLVLPSMGGLEVCRRLREKGNGVPIIMLTGRKRDEIDKVLGLELGADDYMLKPFGVREFVARVRAVLRRGRDDAARIDATVFGDVSVDFRRKTATKGGKDLSLTAKEFGLLELLVAHEGGVIGRDRILNEVWGYDKFPTTRTIDTFIRNLRRKVEDDPSKPAHILTVPWLGYKFKA
jgi:two-component system alkaline phosphatase synthesis response regulator PhoP